MLCKSFGIKRGLYKPKTFSYILIHRKNFPSAMKRKSQQQPTTTKELSGEVEEKISIEAKCQKKTTSRKYNDSNSKDKNIVGLSPTPKKKYQKTMHKSSKCNESQSPPSNLIIEENLSETCISEDINRSVPTLVELCISTNKELFRQTILNNEDNHPDICFLDNESNLLPPLNIFKNINQSLKEDNFDFLNDPNPLNTILRYEKGYYFLPVFYALCQTLKIQSCELIPQIRRYILDNDDNYDNQDTQFLLKLLDKLEKIDSKLIENISQNFTFDTILYCGTNLKNVSKTKLEEKIQNIVRDMKVVLLLIDNADEMVDQIKRIQERYFPTMVVTLHPSRKKPMRFMWNLTHEYWQEVDNDSDEEMYSIIINIILTEIQNFLTVSNNQKDFIKEINVNDIVSAILSKTNNVNRKIVDMDRHKWHIRTEYGILDLLTGHVGATVPEFYMSQRRMSIPLNRHQLMDLRDNREDLIQIYKTLTDKFFFQTFLKKISLDETNDLHDILLSICENKNIEDEYISSIYNFYLHACKYNLFEYDRLMYFFDVISSTLVATNYARKFFILKGNGRNGKSNFFKMLARVFGGYSHTIRSVNLQTTAQLGLNAIPELSSSLFGCRVVIVEEISEILNENLVKEIIGNSTSSFRNLNEQNSGGIPTAKIFASTNIFPECTAIEAFKDKVVVFPFESVFTEKAYSLKPSQQVLQKEYLLETSDSIVEDSYIGFFLIMYLHLIQNINLEDGTIHYRPEPETPIH